MAARRAGALALTIAAVCCRVLAWALCALTVLLCFSGVSTKLRLVNLVVDLTQALPALIAGYGLVPTPMGGVFRLDFAFVAAGLFVVDYICVRAARLIR